MNMVLAVRATLDSGKIPGLPPATVDKGKEALAPVLGNPLLWVGLFGLVLLGLYFSGRTSRVVKLVALGIMALLVIGWDSDRGVLTAAMGSKQGADNALMTVLAIGAAWALLRGPRGKVAAPGGSPVGGRRGFFRRGRRL